MAKKRRIGNEVPTEPETELESEEDLAILIKQISKQQLIEIIRSVASENKKISEGIHEPANKAIKEPVKESVNQIAASDLASSSGPIDVSQWQMVVRRKSSSREETLQRKIFVGNVISHPEITGAKLHSFFSKFGEIEEGPCGFDKYTGKPKGFAIFMYKTVQGARNALEEPVKNFNGHPLYCERVHGGGSSSDKLTYGSNSPTRNLPLKNDECNGVVSSPRAGAGFSAQNGIMGVLLDQAGVAQPRLRKEPIQGHQLDNSYFSSDKPKYGSNGATTRNLHLKNDGCNNGGISPPACAQNRVMGHRVLSDQGGTNGVAQPYRVRKEPTQGHQLDNSYFSSNKLKYCSNGATRNLHLMNDGCNHGGISPKACVGAGCNAQNWGMGHDQGAINGAAQRYGRGKKPIQGHELDSHELDTPCRTGPSGHGHPKGSALARTGVCVACVGYYLEKLILFILYLVGALFVFSGVFDHVFAD